MKAFSILTLLVLLVSPCVSFSETWEEFLKLKATDEKKTGLIPKGGGKLIPKDIIVEQLKQGGEAVFESDSINFDFGSWRLNEVSMPQLAEIAAALTDSRLKDSKFFYVDGHACAIGSDENNCQLSRRRAQSVVELLISPGNVSASKLVVRGFGERMPKFSNDSEETRKRNRRVVLRSAYDPTSEEKRMQCIEGAISPSAGFEQSETTESSSTTLEEKSTDAPRGFKRIQLKDSDKTQSKGAPASQGVFKETIKKESPQAGESDEAAPKGFKRLK